MKRFACAGVLGVLLDAAWHAAALAGDCHGPSDGCDMTMVNTTAVAAVAAIAAAIAILARAPEDPCAEARERCEEGKAAARDAIEDAKRASAEFDAYQKPFEEAKATRRQAQDELDAINATADSSSWVEDAQTGRRITTGDLRLLRGAAQDAWRRYRRGEITAQQLEDEWNDQYDPNFLDGLRKHDAETRDARRAAAQKRLDDANAKIDSAANDPEYDRLEKRANEANGRAIRLEQRARVDCEDLAYCEQKNGMAPTPPVAPPGAPPTGGEGPGPPPVGPAPVGPAPPDDGGLPPPPPTPPPDQDPCRANRRYARESSVAAEKAYAAAQAALQVALAAYQAFEAFNTPDRISQTLKQQSALARQANALQQRIADHARQIGGRSDDQIGAMEAQVKELWRQMNSLNYAGRTLYRKATAARQRYDELSAEYERLDQQQIAAVNGYNECASGNSPAAGPEYPLPQRPALPVLHPPPTPQIQDLGDDDQTDDSGTGTESE